MHKRNKFPYLILFLIMISSLLDAARLIIGDQINSDQTFDFSIGVHATDSNRNGVCLFTGTGEDAGDNFTIAQRAPMATMFVGWSPEIVKKFNQDNEVDNPFRNKKIRYLSTLSREGVGANATDFIPTFVIDNEPEKIYVIIMRYSNGEIDVIANTDINTIKDASGTDPISSIVGLEGAGRETIFAAVRDNAGNDFGVGNSGIALMNVLSSMKAEDGQTMEGPFLRQPFVAALNNESPFIRITNDIASMANIVTMHWDTRLARLFIGLQVTTGADGGDGGRAVCIGRVEQMVNDEGVLIGRMLILDEIVPATAIEGTTKVIGAISANQPVSIHALRTLQVSNTSDFPVARNISYLIVHGGVGELDDTKRSVFALPIVCKGAATNIGKLASKESAIEDMFTTLKHPSRAAHCLVDVAQDPDDLHDETDAAVRVGGGPISSSDGVCITDIQVIGDSVFVSVSSTEDSFKPGIFYSQAILDERNVVVGWTIWQRYAGAIQNTFGFATDSLVGNTVFLCGDDASSVFNVKYTEWGPGSVGQTGPLLSALSQLGSSGGVQGFADFPSTTNGFDGTESIAISLANEKIVIGQMSKLDGGTNALCPTQGAVSTVFYKNGTIDQVVPSDTDVVVIEGGALSTVGSTVTAAITENSDQSRLFVGGVHGIAVLVDPVTGNGWSGPGMFDNLTVGMTFKTLGEYCFVRKLVNAGQFLYVLTNDRLDRIDLDNTDFVTGELSVETVAAVDQLLASSRGAFIDLLVSEKFALLATTQGLYRVGSGANIETAANQQEVAWTSVPLPFGVGPVVQLQAIAFDNKEPFFAVDNPANVYALSYDAGNNRARIHRFAVKAIQGNSIDNSTIQLLSDVYQKDVPQYFINPGYGIQQFTTNGALVLFGQNRNLAQLPKVSSMRAVIPILNSDVSRIMWMGNNNGSGSRLVVTNAGLFTNE